jgi:hypothetical protein
MVPLGLSVLAALLFHNPQLATANGTVSFWNCTSLLKYAIGWIR